MERFEVAIILVVLLLVICMVAGITSPTPADAEREAIHMGFHNVHARESDRWFTNCGKYSQEYKLTAMDLNNKVVNLRACCTSSTVQCTIGLDNN